jgi:hypothetical protein
LDQSNSCLYILKVEMILEWIVCIAISQTLNVWIFLARNANGASF